MLGVGERRRATAWSCFRASRSSDSVFGGLEVSLLRIETKSWGIGEPVMAVEELLFHRFVRREVGILNCSGRERVRRRRRVVGFRSSIVES